MSLATKGFIGACGAFVLPSLSLCRNKNVESGEREATAARTANARCGARRREERRTWAADRKSKAKDMRLETRRDETRRDSLTGSWKSPLPSLALLAPCGHIQLTLLPSAAHSHGMAFAGFSQGYPLSSIFILHTVLMRNRNEQSGK